MILNEDQKMIRDSIRELVNDKIKPRARMYDEKEVFPEENIKDLRETGFLYMTLPEKYGGIGADMLTYATTCEEIARGCAATATIFAGNNSLGISPILTYGNEEQKERFLPKFAEEGGLGAFCLSEPHAGSDPASLSTRARLEGDEWLINGSKFYITNAKEATVFIVFARSNDQPGHRGVSAFIVPAETPGITVMPPEKKLGIKASVTSAMTFEDVRIPKENLLGEEGKGIRMALSILDKGRIAVAAQAVGIAQAAYEDSIKYAKERTQFNQPISNFQAIQFMIADMATRIEAGRTLYQKAALLVDNGKNYVKEAAIAKLYASESATFVTHRAIQIHGGAGFLKDFEVERYYRDARITEIYEGTSEIMRLVIAREALK
ncbi:MAG: acyl-CoA dehydrogenase [Methanobacteriota archaeon]|nr:MAG: acyl-CoA dehydrogenase [Euryarchaeota archaeon]